MNRLRRATCPAACRLVVLLGVLLAGSAHAQFDHEHAAWNALLQKYVVVFDHGRASQVNYAGMQRDRAALKTYLATLSAVTPQAFDSWSKAQQMAFLINAYNAFTVEKILMRYPDIGSIWDFGKIFGNPFKDAFFTLLGQRSYLDRIEHEILRKPGTYDEPRVHFSVNCASVGCPMLREEAYVAHRLNAQLEEQTRRFLADRSRNRYREGRLEVSMIFHWFKEDWTNGFRGFDGSGSPISSREQWLGRYADLFAEDPGARAAIRDGKVPLRFLDYDWRLNDAGKR